MKATRWNAIAVPSVRDDMLRTCTAYTRALEPRARVLDEQGSADGYPTLRQYSVFNSHVEQLADAELYWVTEPMARLAMDASLDLPAFDLGNAPSRCGVMCFAEPLPPVGESQPIKALSWAIEGQLMVTIVWGKTTSSARHRMGHRGELSPQVWMAGMHAGPEQLEDRAWRDVASFLHAAWVLMISPRTTIPSPAVAPTLAQPSTVCSASSRHQRATASTRASSTTSARETSRGVAQQAFVYYHKGMAIEFTDSAARHGFTREDAIHAMQTPETFAPCFDHSRTGGPAVSAWVGPARGGRTIEVFATLIPPDTIVVFHCMELRASTTAKLNGERQ